MKMSPFRAMGIAAASLLTCLSHLACTSQSPARGAESIQTAAAATDIDEPRILVFSKTAGYVHTVIPDAQIALIELGAEHGLGVDTTSDAARFSESELSPYAAVVWLNTTGDVLNDAQQLAFERYIRGGKGYVGIHAAADTEYDWPFYRELVGRQFVQHPEHQTATIHTIASDFPQAMAGFGDSLTLREEWYEYTVPYATNLTDIMRIDTATYSTYGYSGTEKMGVYHPLAWYHEHAGGRAFYTGMGHMEETFALGAFRDHLWAGIRWAMGGGME